MITIESLYDDLEIKLSELREAYRVGEFMAKNAEPTDGMTSVHRYIDGRKWKHVEDKLLKALYDNNGLQGMLTLIGDNGGNVYNGATCAYLAKEFLGDDNE